MQKKFLRTAFYGIQTKEHKQENLSSRKRRRFKQELKAEEGEESPVTSWVKVQRLNTQYGRTQTVQYGSRTARRVRDEDARLTEAPLMAHPVRYLESFQESPDSILERSVWLQCGKETGRKQ